MSPGDAWETVLDKKSRDCPAANEHTLFVRTCGFDGKKGHLQCFVPPKQCETVGVPEVNVMTHQNSGLLNYSGLEQALPRREAQKLHC